MSRGEKIKISSLVACLKMQQSVFPCIMACNFSQPCLYPPYEAIEWSHLSLCDEVPSDTQLRISAPGKLHSAVDVLSVSVFGGCGSLNRQPQAFYSILTRLSGFELGGLQDPEIYHWGKAIWRSIWTHNWCTSYSWYKKQQCEQLCELQDQSTLHLCSASCASCQFASEFNSRCWLWPMKPYVARGLGYLRVHLSPVTSTYPISYSRSFIWWDQEGLFCHGICPLEYHPS